MLGCYPTLVHGNSWTLMVIREQGTARLTSGLPDQPRGLPVAVGSEPVYIQDAVEVVDFVLEDYGCEPLDGVADCLQTAFFRIPGC